MKFSLLSYIAFLFFLSGCANKQARYLPILGSAQYDSVNKDTVYHTIANFSVTDQMGQVITQDTFKGKVYVANFFFVTCPGICHEMNDEMERVAKSFPGNEKVKFLSFTINPEEDSVPVLLKYANQHNAVPYQWYFARGDKYKMLDLARLSYLLATDGALVHSPNLTLVDSQGRIRGVYSGTVKSDVDKLITDIPLLLKEESENKRS